jgi:hypothetical protein
LKSDGGMSETISDNQANGCFNASHTHLDNNALFVIAGMNVDIPYANEIFLIAASNGVLDIVSVLVTRFPSNAIALACFLVTSSRTLGSIISFQYHIPVTILPNLAPSIHHIVYAHSQYHSS